MTLANVPSLELIWDALRTGAIPAAFCTAGIFIVAATLFGRRLPVAVGGLAWAAGVLAANHFRGALEYRIDTDQPWSLAYWWRAVTAALTGQSSLAPRLWLPWIVVVGMIVGQFVSRMPRLGWIVFGALALAGGRMLSGGGNQHPWLQSLSFAAVAIAALLVLRQANDWLADDVVAVVAAIVFAAAAGVAYCAHSARLADVALMSAAAFLGLAMAAHWTGGLASSAWPAVAIGLPGIMLLARNDVNGVVADSTFALAAASPLVLALPLLPLVSRMQFVKRPVAAIISSAAVGMFAYARAAQWIR